MKLTGKEVRQNEEMAAWNLQAIASRLKQKKKR